MMAGMGPFIHLMTVAAKGNVMVLATVNMTKMKLAFLLDMLSSCSLTNNVVKKMNKENAVPVIICYVVS